MKIFSALVLLALSAPAYASETTTFVSSLKNWAYECEIIGATALANADTALQKHGANSYEVALSKSKIIEAPKICIEDKMESGNASVDQEIRRHPQLRAAIGETYSKWITYLFWLVPPHPLGTVSVEKTAFEMSAIRLQAQIDSL